MICERLPPPLDTSFVWCVPLSISWTGTSRAGGRSQPRWASGECSVYRKKDFETSSCIFRVELGSSVTIDSKSIGRPWASGNTYDILLRISSAWHHGKMKLLVGTWTKGLLMVKLTTNHTIYSRYHSMEVDLDVPWEGFHINRLYFGITMVNDRYGQLASRCSWAR